jgi:YidC/Oxa1 family membrane protein insertase
MDKRMILALALSFLVVIVWSFLFTPKTKPPGTSTQEVTPPPVEESTTDQEPARPVTPPPSRAEEQVGPTIPADVSQEEIVVDTLLYRAVLSTVGPSIRSFRLKNYKQSTSPDAPPVEMISPESGDFLRVGFNGASPSGDRKIAFRADRERLSLGPQSPPKELVLRGRTQEGLSLNQTLRFYPDRYQIDLEMTLANESEMPVTGTFEAAVGAMPPQEKRSYYSYVGLVALQNGKLEELKIKEAGEEKTLAGQLDWVAYEDDYFITAVVPRASSPGGTLKGRKTASGKLEGRYLEQPQTIDPNQRSSESYRLYLGPRDLEILKNFGSQLEKAVNFGWFDIIAKPLLYTLRFFNQYIGNYGLSIILLTVLIKILFWPLTHKSYKSMKEMQKLQPMMAKIREKYKDNKEQMQKELMSLYRTYKVNPMGGCLPMVIQIPVFFALFRLLGNSIELRHAPFALWIDDLSAPDRLFSFPFAIPLMTPPYGIPVLTLLMGASMFIQQKMTPTPGDPTQAKIMMLLPIVFTFLFINFPSGLVLYWLVNNVLSIGQQYRIQRSKA